MIKLTHRSKESKQLLGLVQSLDNSFIPQGYTKLSHCPEVYTAVDKIADPISIAIAINGEALASSIATVTPAALTQFNNVSSTAFISVPLGCCSQISVQNVSTQTIDVQNANLIVERVA